MKGLSIKKAKADKKTGKKTGNKTDKKTIKDTKLANNKKILKSVQKNTYSSMASMKSHIHNIKNKHKLNIILDLDATLIEAKLIGMPTNLYLSEGISKITTFDLVNEKYILFMRPFLRLFLDKIKTIANIGVWTTASQNYAKSIVKILFGEDWKNNLNLFICQNQMHSKHIDVLNGRTFDLTMNNNNVKNLSYLFTNAPYSSNFNKNNTILIDDNSDHYVSNRGYNILHVGAWNKSMTSDIILLRVLHWLNTNIKTHKLSEQLPLFLTHDENNKMKYEDTYIKHWTQQFRKIQSVKKLCKYSEFRMSPNPSEKCLLAKLEHIKTD